MNVNSLLQEIEAVGAELGIQPCLIQGQELKERGFGGKSFGILFTLCYIFGKTCGVEYKIGIFVAQNHSSSVLYTCILQL